MRSYRGQEAKLQLRFNPGGTDEQDFLAPVLTYSAYTAYTAYSSVESQSFRNTV